MGWLTNLTGGVKQSLQQLQDTAAQQQGIATLPNPMTNQSWTVKPADKQQIAPSSLLNQENVYNTRTSEYDFLRDNYDRSLRNQQYSGQAHNRNENFWGQLEQQRASGGGYGSDRYYMNGEIYNYDPQAQTYRGSISGNMINQPGEWTPPALSQNPGEYDTYMADDPYFQLLQDTTNPDSPNYSAPASAPVTAPVANVRPPKPPLGSNTNRDWIWNGRAWVREDK